MAWPVVSGREMSSTSTVSRRGTTKLITIPVYHKRYVGTTKMDSKYTALISYVICFYYLVNGSNAMRLLQWRSGRKSNETIQFLLSQPVQTREECQSSVAGTVWGTWRSWIHGKIQRKEEDGENTVRPWTVNKCSGWATYLGQPKNQHSHKWNMRQSLTEAKQERFISDPATFYSDEMQEVVDSWARSVKQHRD